MTRHLEAIAKAYLERNALHHMDMLQPIRRGSAEVLAANPRGVLLIEKASRTDGSVARVRRRVPESN